MILSGIFFPARNFMFTERKMCVLVSKYKEIQPLLEKLVAATGMARLQSGIVSNVLQENFDLVVPVLKENNINCILT